jgi:S1-C subfamily serine protease
MRKKLFSALLAVCMAAALFPAATYAAGLSYFTAEKTYVQGQYTDVSSTNTFVDNVRTAYELGLMQGQSSSYFGVKSNLTRLAALIIACRIHSIYTSGTDHIESDYSGTTQEIYLQYARANGIYTLFSSWSVSATRAEYALILGSALPDAALTATNTVADGAIPDVSSSAACYSAVYRLYRAGVLIGNDSSGTFAPDSGITRGAAAAIATRMVSPTLRRAITLAVSNAKLTSEQIYAKCSPAVAYLEVQNSAGTTYASGSGFFINASGAFVTCYHVISGASAATVTTTDGTVHAVSGVYAYSTEHDWAVLKVSGSGFSYLTAAPTSENVGGATVYAIGSPLGLKNTISQGIISNTGREEDGTEYIQTTAAISSGSSGGALISATGRVLGITCASYTSGQNLNLAVPMSYVTGYSTGTVTALSKLTGTSSAGAYGTLVSYLKSSGTYDSQNGDYYVDTLQSGTNSEEYACMAYLVEEDTIVFGYTYTDTNGYLIGVYLYIPAVSTKYQALMASDDYAFQCAGTVTASSLTADTAFSAATFSSSGIVSQADAEKMMPSMLTMDLAYAEDLMEEGNTGLTVSNFGFTSLYKIFTS